MPNLWALWGSEITTSVIFVSSQCIALKLTFQQSSIYIAAIYASNSHITRRLLWANLTNLQSCFHGPWLFVGDFNAVLGAHEKRGHNPPLHASCWDFSHLSNANLLTHLPTSGPLYTWHNGRFGTENVSLRLDRSVCNED